MVAKRAEFCRRAACFVLAAGFISDSAAQSLADAAQREAARRQRVEQSGAPVKVVEGNGERAGGRGNVSVSNFAETAAGKNAPASPAGSDSGSLRRYRDSILRLDRDIRKEEDRLKSLRTRLEALNRERLRLGDASRLGRNENARMRAGEQIAELRSRLNALQRERAEVYDAGRKAGYLPGELEGKGIVP
jgi:chromosome segregation ATPase